MDQGLFSGANFLVNILLARWLAPGEYGAFAVSLSIFYFFSAFHTAVLTEPMMVFGTGKYQERFFEYLKAVLYGHWRFSILVALLFGSVALVVAHLGLVEMAHALAGLAVAFPFLLLLWLVRRVPYVEMTPQWAVVGGIVNLIVITLSLYLVNHFYSLSSFLGFMILGVSAGVTSMVIFGVLSKHFSRQNQGKERKGRSDHSLMWLKVMATHWGYGKWSLVATLSYLLSGQVAFLLVPIFLGLEKSALLAAVLNIYRPMVLVIQSLYSLLLPSFSRSLRQKQYASELKRVSHRVITISAIFGAIMFLYGLAAVWGSDKIFFVLYNGKYEPSRSIIGIMGIMYVFSAMSGVLFTLLKAEQKIKTVASIQSVSAGAMVLVSIPAMYLANIFGAVMSMAFSYGLALVLALFAVISR